MEEQISLSQQAMCPSSYPALNSATRTGKRGISRRLFLQGMSATFVALPVLPKCLLTMADPRVDRTETGVCLSWEGFGKWDLDTSWLAGRPQMDVQQQRGRSINLVLNGARYPGTKISADFQATLDFDAHTPVIRMKHSLSSAESQADLALWLRGEAKLESMLRGMQFVFLLGDFLSVRQVATAQLQFTPALEIRVVGADPWLLDGKEFSGRASELLLARASGTELIDSPQPLRRTHLLLTPSSEAGIRVQPELPSSAARYRVGSSYSESLLLETAEGESGKRHSAFVSQGKGAVVVASADSLPGEFVSRVIAREARYSRVLSSYGYTEVAWQAVQGQGMVGFGPHTLVTMPATQSLPLRISGGATGCKIDCTSNMQTLVLASDDDVSITLRFPSSTGTKKSSADARSEICPFTFCHKELPLEGAEITFKRPANALLLRFRIEGMKLVRNWRGIKLIITDRKRCRLRLVLGAQAVVERSFYEPPDKDHIPSPCGDNLDKQWERLQDSLKIKYRAAPPTELKEFISSAKKQFYSENKYPNNTEWENDGVLPSRARVSGESQLVYRLKRKAPRSKIRDLSLDLDRLLDEELWELVIVKDAASSEDARNKDKDFKFVAQSGKDEPPENATFLEMPGALYISPNEHARFRVEGLNARSESGFRDIFRFSAFMKNGGSIPLRAIGAREFSPYISPAQLHPAVEFRTPLDAGDRSEFVWLTSQWGYAALLGTHDVREKKDKEDELPHNPKVGFDGVYVPRPFEANRLLLTSMGGSLQSKGLWDPPALSKFALSVERWEHSSTFARSHLDVVVYKGFLLPFGVRCALIKETRRQERRLNDLGVVSLPIQKYYLEISSPRATYTGALVPYQGRTWPFRSIELLLRGRLEINPPTESQFGMLGQSAFRIWVGIEGYGFEFQIDDDPKRRGVACLAFIDNSVAHDASILQYVVDEFNLPDPNQWAKPPLPGKQDLRSGSYSIDLRRSKVQYAPPRNGDDTSYVTETMGVRLGLNKELVNSTIVEASGKPPTFPEMQSAKIVIPALNRLTGRPDSTNTEVEFFPLYMQVGFGATSGVSNTSEVFLHFLNPIVVSFSGKGDRSGAVGAPNIDAHYLSRQVGVMGKAADLPLTSSKQVTGFRVASMPLASSQVTFNAADLFRSDAKILGVLPMSVLFDALGLDQVPKFIESVKHQIDATAGEIVPKARDFARSGGQAVKELLASLDKKKEDLQRFEPVGRLQGYLKEFQTALENLSQDGVDLVTITKQIALAGQALERARRTAEDVLQHPATLLPAQVTSLIKIWTELAAALTAQYLRLQDVQRDQLRDRIQQAQRDLEAKANGIIAYQVNLAFSKLSQAIEQVLSQSVPVERQLQQFIELYAAYQKIYDGTVSWYRELAANKEDYRKPLAALAGLFLGQDASGYVGCVMGKVEQPLGSLDTALRQWTALREEKVREQGRAFFRRYEPVLDRVIQEAMKYWNQTAKLEERPILLEYLRQSLDDLAQAVKQELSSGSLPPDFRQYLKALSSPEDSAGLVEQVRKEFGQAALDFGQQKAATELETLRAALDHNNAAVLRDVVDNAVNAWKKGIGKPEELQRVLVATNRIAELCVVVGTGFEDAQGAVAQVESVVTDTMNLLQSVAFEWLKVVVLALERFWDLLQQTSNGAGYLFAPEFIRSVPQWKSDLEKARNDLSTTVPFPTLVQFGDVLKHLATAAEGWHQLASQLKALGEAPDRAIMENIRSRVADLLGQLVPAEIHLDFTMDTEITQQVGGVFLPGNKDHESASLHLLVNLQQNLKSGESHSEITGELKYFQLHLLELLTITFDRIHFKASSGAAPQLDPPTITDIVFDGCLKFVNELRNFFKRQSGPYVRPVPTGIKAGYALCPGTIPLPPMVIQDLVLDAGIEVPFDDRAAVTTFAISSREMPALLFIAPYGGTMYFALAMAGDRLVNIESSFEAGLVAAFDLGVVNGSGRLTLGFYYRQSAGGMILDGFFYAGGHGTILGLVSIGLNLRIGLSYQEAGVKGYGDFSVEMGSSPFTLTLNYRVERAVSKEQLLASGKAPSGGADPVDPLQSPRRADLFLDPETWREFRSAFVNF